MKSITKRDGSVVPFSIEKITDAIRKAFLATGEIDPKFLDAICMKIAGNTDVHLNSLYSDPVYIEDIQNEVRDYAGRFRRFCKGVHPISCRA